MSSAPIDATKAIPKPKQSSLHKRTGLYMRAQWARLRLRRTNKHIGRNAALCMTAKIEAVLKIVALAGLAKLAAGGEKVTLKPEHIRDGVRDHPVLSALFPGQFIIARKEKSRPRKKKVDEANELKQIA